MPWYRVFAALETVPHPASLAAFVQDRFPQVRVTVRGEAADWLEADLDLPASRGTWKLRRYCRQADDIRGELQSWAAWIEWQPPSPHQHGLMERIMTAQQVFTLDADADPPWAPLAEAVMKYLANATDGVIQIDGRGFLAADGALLLAEND